MTDPISSVTEEILRRGSLPRPGRKVGLLLVISLLVLTACAAPTPSTTTAVSASPTPPIAAGADPVVAQATTDLARRTGQSPSDVRVLVVERRVWPDASLGCPRPGQA